MHYLGYNKYIAVEKSPDARCVRSAANANTGNFPGVTHGLHDIFDIKEENIGSFPKNSIKLFGAGPECNDFSKFRLLLDRPGYKGAKREPGTDPRKGLPGKHGKTFRQVIKPWGWILNHHPDCKFRIENVDFRDMEADWAEVRDALGQPLIIISQDHSYTKRCTESIVDRHQIDERLEGRLPTIGARRLHEVW